MKAMSQHQHEIEVEHSSLLWRTNSLVV